MVKEIKANYDDILRSVISEFGLQVRYPSVGLDWENPYSGHVIFREEERKKFLGIICMPPKTIVVADIKSEAKKAKEQITDKWKCQNLKYDGLKICIRSKADVDKIKSISEKLEDMFREEVILLN